MLLLALGHLVQRRHGDVHIAVFDQRTHIAIEEREHQDTDVRAVHVSVCHADDAVIAQLFGVKFLADAAAEGGDHVLDFLVEQDLVKARLFDVENLAAQGQDGLIMAVTARLGGAAGGIALNDENFAFGGVALRAVRQLAGQACALQNGLAARQIARLAGSLARAGSTQAPVKDNARNGGIFLQIGGQALHHHAVHNRTHFAVAKFTLGLALKLRLVHLDRYDSGNALAHVLALERSVALFEDGRTGLVAAVVVDGSGQRRLEARQVRAALGRVNVISKGINILREAIVILQGDFDGHAVLDALDIDRLGEKHLTALVQILHKLADTALVVENALLLHALALVAQHDLDALVEEGHLAHARFEDVVLESDIGIEHAVGVLFAADIRPELHGGTRALAGVANHLQVIFDDAAVVLLAVNLAALVDGNHQVAGKRIYNGCAYAVQAAGYLIAVAAELAAGVQDGQAHLDCGTANLGMHAHGETAAVILHFHRAVRLERDNDIRAVAGQRLVHGVVHNFIYAMMQSAVIRRADVHARAAADGLQAFQHLDVVFVIMPLLLLRGQVQFICHLFPPENAKMGIRRYLAILFIIA